MFGIFLICFLRNFVLYFKIINSGKMGKILVNGNEQVVDFPVSIADVIKSNNVFQPDMVSVQLNGEFVSKDDYESSVLGEGDEVDFLYFMGGGQKIKAFSHGL